MLRDARPRLLDLGEQGSLAAGRSGRSEIASWEHRVRLLRAAYDGVWDLPVLGVVSGPSAVLVRPDGYLGWVGEGSEAGLVDALARWFGPAAGV